MRISPDFQLCKVYYWQGKNYKRVYIWLLGDSLITIV